MYTKCPDCATIFRVSADALRAAEGSVRCGVCSTSFDALESLSDDPFGAAVATDEPQARDVAVEADELPDSEGLDPLMVETPAADSQHMSAVTRAGEPPPTVDPGAIAAALTTGRNDRNSIDENSDFTPDELDDIQPDPDEAAHFRIPDEMQRDLDEEAFTRAFNAPQFEDLVVAEGPRRWPWAVGAAILAVALAVQVIHAERDRLIGNPAVGPLLARVYSLVGLPLLAPTDLSAYELRQWGATSDPAQAGRLLLRASIVNRAGYAQPYPLLRLALQDRFGTTIGVRDVEPVDYLPGTGAGTLLEPGQRADAEVRIVDPGKDAVGFEMDVCLAKSGRVHCANEAPRADK